MCPHFPLEFSNLLIDVTEILELIGCSLKKKTKIVQRNAFKLNVRALQAWPVPFWFCIFGLSVNNFNSLKFMQNLPLRFLAWFFFFFFCGILSLSLFWLPSVLCNEYKAIVVIVSYPLFCLSVIPFFTTNFISLLCPYSKLSLYIKSFGPF